jgi:hypothetical protein
VRDKVNELETNSENKNIGDLCGSVNVFKKVAILLADSHSIFNGQNN